MAKPGMAKPGNDPVGDGFTRTENALTIYERQGAVEAHGIGTSVMNFGT
jgi:hypothetical protein